MKKISCIAGAVSLCLALGLCFRFFVGCEAAKGLDGLTVNPSSVILTPGTNAVVFTVTLNTTNTLSLSLPLVWSVSNSSLGSIAGGSGFSAVYSATANLGQNIITARDQYGNEGFATVTQTTASTSTTSTTGSSGTTTTTTTTTTSATTTTTLGP